MVRKSLILMAVAGCMVGIVFSDDKRPAGAGGDTKSLDGLWRGGWGGGEQGDGVIFTPVLAEAFIKGDRIELSGFRNHNRLEGTFRVDARMRRIHITPAAKADEKSQSPAIAYRFELKGENLTLTDSDNVQISLQKIAVSQSPLADAQVEFAVASKIDEAGDLLVTDQVALRAGRDGDTLYQPQQRAIKIKTAAIFVVQEKNWKKTSLEAIRTSLRESTPVALAYRKEAPSGEQTSGELWQRIGAVSPDSDPVLRTISRLLRPGTIVFILSRSENLPVP